MYIAFGNSYARQGFELGWDTITLYHQWQAFPVKSRRCIVINRFDPDKHRLMFVTAENESFHLYIVGPTAEGTTEIAGCQNYNARNPWVKKEKS